MITGKLNELEAYMDAESMHKILTFTEQIKSGEIGANEWFFFDADRSFKAIALHKSNYQAEVKEFHKIYTDIHIPIKGTDTIFTGVEIKEVIEPYQDNNDYCLVRSESETFTEIPPGYFALLKPEEIHSSLLSGKYAVKAVIKIKTERIANKISR